MTWHTWIAIWLAGASVTLAWNVYRIRRTLADVTPELWQPWDCCAVFLVRHVAFAGWQKKLWRGRLAARLGA